MTARPRLRIHSVYARPARADASAIALYVLIAFLLASCVAIGYWVAAPSHGGSSGERGTIASTYRPAEIAASEPAGQAGPLITPVIPPDAPVPTPAMPGPTSVPFTPPPPRPVQAPVPVLPHEVVTNDGRFLGGMPQATDAASKYEVLVNTAYTVGYSETRKDPLWSAYKVIYIATPYHIPRPKGNFLTDERTDAKVTHHDFTGSGFDRGHMTPNNAIARCFGEDAQRETFLLSNICPQAPALNQKVWEKLEQAEIDYTGHFETVWVIDGPIFADLNGGKTKTLKAGIAIPVSFYKIVARLDPASGDDGVSEFAVIMPQTVKGTELPAQYLTSVDKIQTQTHLRFFTSMTPAAREAMTAKVFPMW